MVHRNSYWHHLGREAGSLGLKRSVWIQAMYVAEATVAIERRGWLCPPGPVLREQRMSRVPCGEETDNKQSGDRGS